jgi:hypothetical protein
MSMGVLLALATSAGAQTLPADAKPTCVVTPAVFNSWFVSGSVAVNGPVKPANSITFPNTPNCSFYQWSEQMFLWLTSPAPATYGSGRVFDSAVFFDVSPPDTQGNRVFIPHPNLALTPNAQAKNLALRAAQVGPHGLPIVFDKKGQMLEIERTVVAPNGRQVIQDQAGKRVEIASAKLGANKQPIFLDAAGKTIAKPKPILRPQLLNARVAQRFMIGLTPIILNSAGNVVEVEVGQAGGDGVLMAQNNSLIFYESMANDVYAWFLTGTKKGGITPTPTQFPTNQASLNKVIAYHGSTFPDAVALAIEVKSSWIEATGLANLGSYITMNAIIPTYTKNGPNTIWTPSGQKLAKLALLGVHVVGSANGHPEMIWATFEHFGNTPNATYQYVSTTNVTKTVTQSTAGTWLFTATNAGPTFNQVHMDASTPPNITAVSPFTVSPSNTIRWKAFGAASNQTPNPLDATPAASNTEILAINNAVLGMIPNGDLRKNYYMSGSTWTIGGAAPTGPFSTGNEVGTSMLANSTMESYQQGSSSQFNSGGTNCFSCHTTNTTSVSHIFGALKPLP